MKSELNQNADEKTQKLVSIIKDLKIAMMTSPDQESFLRSRPMETLDVDFDGDLWFFTARNADPLLSAPGGHGVNLAYSSSGKNQYVSVSGNAEIISDEARTKELWRPEFVSWFPEGLQDPNLALLRVRVSSAEYWDAGSSAMVYLIGTAKALISGEPYRGEAGDHQKISLRH